MAGKLGESIAERAVFVDEGQLLHLGSEVEADGFPLHPDRHMHVVERDDVLDHLDAVPSPHGGGVEQVVDKAVFSLLIHQGDVPLGGQVGGKGLPVPEKDVDNVGEEELRDQAPALRVFGEELRREVGAVFSYGCRREFRALVVRRVLMGGEGEGRAVEIGVLPENRDLRPFLRDKVVGRGIDHESGIPEDAELRVREILPGDENYEAYRQQSLDMVGVIAVPDTTDTTEDGQASEGSDEDTAAETALEESTVSTYAHIFDIQIWADDQEIQPASEVSVSIKLYDVPEEDTELRVVHFSKDGPEEMDLTGDSENAGGSEINFMTDEFSVYAIVPGPSGTEAGWVKLNSLDGLLSKGFYIGHTSGYYLKNGTTSKTSNGTTLSGITRTGKSAVPTVVAELYYFENAADGKYYIYCMDGENNRQYVVNNGDASLSFEDSGTAFTVEMNSKRVFKIHNGDWYWNMQTGTGEGFYATNKANDGNNNLYLWEATDPGKDTYELDGKSYGLMTWTGGSTAKALMAVENTGTDENEVSYSGCLEAKFLTVMTKASNAGNKLYVPNDTSDTVTKWTFEWKRNDPNDRLISYYFLKADNTSKSQMTA